MKVALKAIRALVVVGLFAAAAIFRPDQAIRVGAGMAAHNLCSAVFVANRDPDATWRELVRPLLGTAAPAFGYRLDRGSHVVRGSFLGLDLAEARYTRGFGCRLAYEDNAAAPSPLPPFGAPVVDSFAPATPVTATDPAIAQAIDRVFAEPADGPPKRVKAVVVVKDGRVIAERYADGFDVNTPLLSYSVAKSFTNALVGLLVRDGKLKVDQPVGAPEWKDDARRDITVENLMRMQSGLDATEGESAFDPVAQMEYLHADMAGFAASRPAKEPPGKTFEYTSANTLILDRLIGKTVGGGPNQLRDWAESELFAPLGMRDVTMEFDGRGTFMGASYVFASARSYARFGQLYLDDGVRDGKRILPEGWVAWSKRSTAGRGYGAGFFTNEGDDEFTAWRVKNGFPKDGYFASGFLGQRIYVVPSAKLVIARFGYSTPPSFGLADDLALIKAAVGP